MTIVELLILDVGAYRGRYPYQLILVARKNSVLSVASVCSFAFEVYVQKDRTENACTMRISLVEKCMQPPLTTCQRNFCYSVTFES
jgi:hypothetical protein